MPIFGSKLLEWITLVLANKAVIFSVIAMLVGGNFYQNSELSAKDEDLKAHAHVINMLSTEITKGITMVPRGGCSCQKFMDKLNDHIKNH